MSRVVELKCERKGCKSSSRLKLQDSNTLLPGWVQVIHWGKEVDIKTGKEETKPVLKDLCSAKCAAEYFREMFKEPEEK